MPFVLVIRFLGSICNLCVTVRYGSGVLLCCCVQFAGRAKKFGTVLYFTNKINCCELRRFVSIDQ